MSSSTSALDVVSTQAKGPTTRPTSPCLFLKVLPLEIRRIIYRYLLASRYIRRELDMNSREYDERRGSILRGPDYSYHLHPSIIWANKQIRAETLEILKGESQFVGILLERTEAYRYWRVALPYNVNILATGARAWAFPNVGMDIDFKVDSSPASDEPENRVVCVIPIEDLPAACAELQKKIRTYTGDDRIVDISLRGYDQVPPTKQARFLEPLRELRGATSVNEYGPGWPSLKDVAFAMCGQRFSANETMDMACRLIDEGDDATGQGKTEMAIARYKAALNTICGNILDGNEEELIVGGRFNGFSAGLAREYICVQLHSLIANSYLRSGHPRLARVYVERIYGPLHSYDHRHNKEKFPLQIPQGHDTEVYAELLVVASKISLFHGHYGEAWAELSEAKDLDPANKQVERQMQELDAVRDKRYHGCARNRDGRKKNTKVKYRASLQVAINRVAKGDEASHNNNLQLARSKYEAAYTKVQATINDPRFDYPFTSNSCNRESSALTIEILPKLTEICLELGDFKTVHRWADEIISRSHAFSYTDTEPQGWESDEVGPRIAEEVVYLAYYCKAVACCKEEGPEALELAMENFEQALVYDAGCHASYYQLEALREGKEAGEERLDVWDRMLRLEWDDA